MGVITPLRPTLLQTVNSWRKRFGNGAFILAPIRVRIYL